MRAEVIGVRTATLRTRVDSIHTVPAIRIPTPVRWLLLLYVFSLPFEYFEFGAISRSPTKLLGLAFFGCYLVYYGPLSAVRSLPAPAPALWGFLGYAVVVGLNILYVPEELFVEFVGRCVTLMQLGLFVWVASGLLKDAKMAKSVLLSFSLASAIGAVGSLLQLPGFYTEFEGRVTALGDNANALAGNAAFALLILIGLFLTKSLKHSVNRLLGLSLTLPLLTMITATGSRSGFLAFLGGCLVYLLPYCRSKRLLVSIVLASALIAGALYKLASNPIFVERFRDSFYEQDLAGREDLFPKAAEMVQERPIFGWGSVVWYSELGRRLGNGGADPHNLWLALLAEVGMAGTIPFFVGFWLCGWSAWKARIGTFGMLPLALFVTMFMIGMSGDTLISKTHWLVVASIVGMSSAVAKESMMLRPLRLRPAQRAIPRIIRCRDR
jgi:O-antigen ligase